MDQQLRRVFVASGEMHAQQVRAFLEASGIEAIERGESLRNTHGLTVDGIGAVEILVAAADADRARSLLDAAEAGAFRLNYDLIFCHNVLIYFSPPVATTVVAFLASCLKQGGYLLLGPGEAPHDRPPGLEPVSVQGVRAFQRRTARIVEVRE